MRTAFTIRMSAILKKIALLITIMTIAACGTMSVSVETQVRDRDDFSHIMTITATEAFAELLMDSETGLDLDDMRASGWDDIEIVRDSGTLTLTMSGTFSGDKAIKFLDSEDNILAGEDADFNIELLDDDNMQNNKYNTYLVSLDMTDTESALGSGSSIEDENPFAEGMEGMEALMAGMFTIDWQLEFPGELVESNAELEDGNKAHWHLNLLDLEKDGEMYLKYRIKNSSGGCS